MKLEYLPEISRIKFFVEMFFPVSIGYSGTTPFVREIILCIGMSNPVIKSKYCHKTREALKLNITSLAIVRPY